MRFLFILFMQFLWLLPGFCQDKPSLYVFLPSEIRPNYMQNLLSDHCPDLEIQVFPRYREFRRAIMESPPDAFLSLRPVVQETLKITDQDEGQAFRIAIVGSSGGKTEQPYIFLSNDKVDINPGNVGDMTIGMVGLLDRRMLPQFIMDKFQVEKEPRLKPVTKLEDLLSLLQFNYVNAIFVPASKQEYYTSKSNMDLNPTTLDITIGLPVIAVSSDAPDMVATLVESFKKIKTKDSMDWLGVESWSQQ